MMHKLFFLASIVLFSAPILAQDVCQGRTSGTFCSDPDGIVECGAQGQMTGTSCATAHVNGKRIDGICIETNDGKAYCRSPTPSPCDAAGPGTYCANSRSLRTCLNDGSMFIDQCDDSQSSGSCVDNQDGQAYCRHPRN